MFILFSGAFLPLPPNCAARKVLVYDYIVNTTHERRKANIPLIMSGDPIKIQRIHYTRLTAK